MSRLTIEVAGLQAMARRLELSADALSKGVAAGIYAVGQNIRSTSMDKTPIDVSTLKTSHYVTDPEGIEAGVPFVQVGCGGDAAKAYALIQHERLDLHHSEGEAKFLEKAAAQEAPDAARVIAAQAGNYLERAARGEG